MPDKNYIMNFVDPTKSPITIPPNTIIGPTGNTKTLDLDLTGLGSALWGERSLENFIHLLENFSCEDDLQHEALDFTANTFAVVGDVRNSFNDIVNVTLIAAAGSPDTAVYTIDINTPATFDIINNKTTITVLETITTIIQPVKAGTAGRPNQSLPFSPSHPVQGQVWYNQTAAQLFVWNVSGSPAVGYWKRANGITVSSNEPPSASDGDLWWDTGISASQLKVYVTGLWRFAVGDFLLRTGDVMSGILDMDNNSIINLPTPQSGYAMTFDYTESNYIRLDGASPAMTGALILNGNPTNLLEATTKQYVDTNFVKSTGDIMSGVLDMGNNKITTTSIPSNDEDVVNVKYHNDNTWPIGSVYISVNAINPSVILGGSWIQIAQGKMLIGQDSANPLFATLPATGGSLDTVNVSHSHTTLAAGSHKHSAGKSTHENGAQFGKVAGSGMLEANTNHIWTNQHPWSSTEPDHTHTVSTAGVSGINKNLPPYFVTYMWQRII